MTKTFFTFGVILFLMLFSNSSYCQHDSMRADMKEELAKIMKEKLVEKVGLSESTADRFLAALDADGKEVRKLMKERRDLMDDIDLDPGAADVETKMDRTIEIDILIAEMRKSFKARLREFMTPQEIAKTMKFRKKFEKEMRKEVKKRRKGPDDNGPGGPPFDGRGGPGGPDGPGGQPPFDR